MTASQAKNPSSRRRVGTRLERTVVLTVSAALLLTVVPGVAHGATSRLFEFGFGSFGNDEPAAVTVDQATGDVYVADRKAGTVSRFDSSGAPKNFTAGPQAGTNEITGLKGSGSREGPRSIAIDNSGGPLDGNVYVAVWRGSKDASPVMVFARTGEKVGELNGDASYEGHFWSPCGIAVDQADGSLYVTEANPGDGGFGSPSFGQVWRYEPSSPSGEVDDADFAVTGGEVENVCEIAVDSGDVYVITGTHGPGDEFRRLERADAGDFSITPRRLTTTLVDQGLHPMWGVRAVDVDPTTGQIYSHRGSGVTVLTPEGDSLYTFGSATRHSISSRALAVKSAAAGSAERVYVADWTDGRERVAAFGEVTTYPALSRANMLNAGIDGTEATSFTVDQGPRQVALHQASRRLYTLDNSVPGLWGFGIAAGPVLSPLAGYSPLEGASGFGGESSGLAVDDSGLAGDGNVYLASHDDDLIYGWDASGAPLGGAFPLDPAVVPGGPAGSPKDLCGAAVDSAGTLFVSNEPAASVLRYDVTGASVGEPVDTSSEGSPCSLALDSSDNLYVAMEGGSGSGVWRYTAASGYTAATQIVVGGRPRIAIERTTGNLLIAEQGFACLGCGPVGWLAEYDTEGNLLGEFAVSPESRFADVTVDSSTGIVYIGDRGRGKLRAFGPAVLLPEAALAPPSEVANESVTLNGRVIAQEVEVEECRFEYVDEAAYRASGFADLSSGGSVACAPAAESIPPDLAEHEVSAEATGLERDSRYRVRLVAANANGEEATEAARFATAGPPITETTGTPLRTATTARLLGRVHPVRAVTTYHFEYGTEGPCASNPCEPTPARPAGAGDAYRFVAEAVEGLSPDTTYYYRLVADNGNADGPSFGVDRTVATRASDATPTHGSYPGPPESDRAWEQVNLPDTGGNPVGLSLGYSDDGNRAAYGIIGGTPIASTGSVFSFYFAERPAGEHPTSGWETRLTTPGRDELVGSLWVNGLKGPDDLSSFVAVNANPSKAGEAVVWRLTSEGGTQKLFQPESGQSLESATTLVSKDAGTVVTPIEGGVLDPAHPTAAEVLNLYEIGDGSPRLVSLLPGETLSPCDVLSPPGSNSSQHRARLLSADGSRLIFRSRGSECSNAPQIYLRDMNAEQSKLVSGPPLSGPACEAVPIKGIPGAVYFWTASRLTAEDTESADCAGTDTVGGDVYRYDTGDGELSCVSCVTLGRPADIAVASGGNNTASARSILVADDGSRVYFLSPETLLPHASPNGLYRVEVASGDLAYLGAPDGGTLTAAELATTAGEVVYFSSSSADLDTLGGATNGGSRQYYRYDDRDRSLVCVSCLADGSFPLGDADVGVNPDAGPNVGGASADGETLAFTTPTPLIDADRNTNMEVPEAGTDVYEWRDGRLLLITDGLTMWPAGFEPAVNGVSPDGRDVYFQAATQYTPDAVDSFRRLYDARIGGGIDFPEEEEPCSLGECQGTQSGAPNDPLPGSEGFHGEGNPEMAPRDCAPFARSARRLVRRAVRMRRVARRAARRSAARRPASRRAARRVVGQRRRARALGRRAQRLQRVAKRYGAATQRCRRVNANWRAAR